MINEHASCLTRGGRHALVPSSAQTADRVFMLFSGQVLYIIRPRAANVTFEYIDEVYVHGLMEGGISDMMDGGELFVERFIVRVATLLASQCICFEK